MAYGICDIINCEEPTYIGWQPKTAPSGRQICELHWNEYKAGTFDLYEAFGIQRPPTMTGTSKLIRHCPCGGELQPGRRYCQSCIADRKRQQRRDSYHRNKTRAPVNNTRTKIRICKSENCENERKPNHRYCNRCAEYKSRKSNRERQRRHYRKKSNVRNGST